MQSMNNRKTGLLLRLAVATRTESLTELAFGTQNVAFLTILTAAALPAVRERRRALASRKTTKSKRGTWSTCTRRTSISSER